VIGLQRCYRACAEGMKRDAHITIHLIRSSRRSRSSRMWRRLRRCRWRRACWWSGWKRLDGIHLDCSVRIKVPINTNRRLAQAVKSCKGRLKWASDWHKIQAQIISVSSLKQCCSHSVEFHHLQNYSAHRLWVRRNRIALFLSPIQKWGILWTGSRIAGVRWALIPRTSTLIQDWVAPAPAPKSWRSSRRWRRFFDDWEADNHGGEVQRRRGRWSTSKTKMGPIWR